MKGIKAVLAGAGALSLASLGMLYGGNANAASAVKLTDNPSTVSSVIIGHKVTNGILPVTADYGYELSKCNTLPDLSSPRAISGTINFDDELLSPDNEAFVTTTLDLSDLTFGAAGTYEFCIRETSSSNSKIDYDKTNQFKIFVDVTNERNSSGDYTGNLVAALAPQALNMTTGEKGEVIFNSEPKLTYIEVTHKVEGDRANLDQYFGYYLLLDETHTLPEGTSISITGVDEYYIDPSTGERKKNLTSIKTGEYGFVYLKHDQVAYLGVEDGKYRLPDGFVYNISPENGSPLEKLYGTRFNDDYVGRYNGRIKNRTELVPEEGASDAVIKQFELMNKVLITRTISGSVSTGVVSKVMPFVVLVVLGAGAALATRYYSAKNKTRA